MLRKKPLFIAGVALALIVVLVVGLVVVTVIRDDDPDLRTTAPEIPTATAVASAATTAPTRTATSAPAAAAGTPASAPGVLRFVVDKAGSEVKYVVREKLTRLPVSSDAVGTTKEISGEIHLTPQGLSTAAKSLFSVDLRTLRTDESLRDNFIRMSVLRTNQFPMAEFVVESLTGFPAGYVEGQEASLTMKGTLTVRGVSKPVEWAVKARRAGDTLTAIADTDFRMTDFGITPPEVPLAKAEDGVHLQITLLARLQPAG